MDNNRNNDILFFKLWRNIVINKIIFKYAALYKNNKCVVFNDLESFRIYEEKEYITTLIFKRLQTNTNRYRDLLIQYNDLPKYGVLKKIDLTYSGRIQIESSNVVPYGVVELHLNQINNELQLSELPTSIKTITNLILKRPYLNNQIPSNITSLSFNKIDPIEFYDIKLPLSIKILDLNCLASLKSELPSSSSSLSTIIKSFIPTSVTTLTTFYEESYKSRLPVIPNSVKKLHLYIGGGNCKFEKGLIPYGVIDLFIHILDYDYGNKLSENSIPDTVTKLSICCINRKMEMINLIPVNSIPNSVTDLYVSIYQYPSTVKNEFPIGLTRLEIKIDSGIDGIRDPFTPLLPELPKIKYLKINNKIMEFNKYTSKL